MAMQAIIMAGGAGTRLRPLTCAMPKPLAPLCGAPVMDYTLRLLKQHGFDRATATLWYRPQDVIDAFGSEKHGVKISYQIEETPLGTAGSVLKAAGNEDQSVLVLSGDGLTSADLTAAIAFHRQRRAAATLVLHRVGIPLAYGVVVTEPDGRITRFVEKPDWSRVVSSLVNTGIYILEPTALALIPSDQPFDFGRELFPLLLEKNLPLYGFESDAYWCDVGDPAAFLRVQGDLLAGRTGFSVENPGIRFLKGVSISEDSYISPKARIEPGAEILSSCVLAGAHIGAGAYTSGAILCENALVDRGAQIESGCVIGSGASAGAFARISAGVHLWPGVSIPDYAVINQSVQQSSSQLHAENGCFRCAEPGQAALLAAAFIKTHGAGSICVAHSGDTAAYHALLGALASYGTGRVWALGRSNLALTSYAVNTLQADGALLAAANGVLPLDKHGLALSDQNLSQIETAALRQELPPLHPNAHAIRAHASLRKAYLQTFAASGENKPPVFLQCKDRFMRALARDALTRAGHALDSRADLILTLNDTQSRIASAELMPTGVQQSLLFASAFTQRGESAYDLWDLDADGLLPPDQSAACLYQQRLWQDPLRRALTILDALKGASLAEALSQLPDLCLRSVDIPCETEQKSLLMEALSRTAAPRPQGGLRAVSGDASAVIKPDPLLPLIRVAASSMNAEHAQEMCDEVTKRIKKLLSSAP